MAKSKSQTPSPSAAEIVTDISLKQIDPPTLNAREDFGDLESLAESIREVGLLQPIVLRNSGKDGYQIVCGERRFRACKHLGWSTIRATIRNFDDRQAAEASTLENLDRQTLNPLEESRALRMLQDLGHDPASLAKLTRMTEADVSTRLRLMELPDFWQDRVREGNLSVAAAEYLLPWIGHPHVLEALQEYADKFPCTLVAWSYYVTETVNALSRPMSGPDGPQFENFDGLDIVTTKKFANGKAVHVKRCMSVDLWDARQDQANAVQAPPHRNGNGKQQSSDTNRNGSPKPKSRKPKVEETPNFVNDETGEFDFPERLAEFKAGWLKQRIIGQLHEMEVSELESLSDQLGIVIDDEWELDRDFLDLHSGRQLYDLAAELQVDPSHARSKAELVAILLHHRSETVPDAFLQAGHVAAAEA